MRLHVLPEEEEEEEKFPCSLHVITIMPIPTLNYSSVIYYIFSDGSVHIYTHTNVAALFFLFAHAQSCEKFGGMCVVVLFPLMLSFYQRVWCACSIPLVVYYINFTTLRALLYLVEKFSYSSWEREKKGKRKKKAYKVGREINFEAD